MSRIFIVGSTDGLSLAAARTPCQVIGCCPGLRHQQLLERHEVIESRPIQDPPSLRSTCRHGVVVTLC